MKANILFSLLLALSLPAVAGEAAHHDHETAARDAASVDEYVNAEVRKIDIDNGKLTLRHEPIQKFGMAAMTMIFRVPDPTMLASLSVGDKVRFIPDKQNGQLVVRIIEKRL
jgi:Cu(I)/Ag(I) efflux system protein CusF